MMSGRMRRLIGMAALAVLLATTATACSKKEVLPKLEKVLSDTDMENLGEQLEAFKEGQASA